MRADMFKVIVERPRRGKDAGEAAAQRRRDFDGPRQLGMRAGYGYRALNENLRPLRRYLHSQVGRPWDKVYSEIASTIDRRNTVQQHVFQHIDDFVAMKVEWRDGHLVDLRSRSTIWPTELRQELYVDPRSGLLRVNKNHLGRKQRYRERERNHEAELRARRRVVDDVTQLHLIEGEWYEIRFAPLPPGEWKDVVVRGRTVRKFVAEARYDVVRKRMTSAVEGSDERAKLYGVQLIYATAKRQLSHREKKSYGLL